MTLALHSANLRFIAHTTQCPLSIIWVFPKHRARSQPRYYHMLPKSCVCVHMCVCLFKLCTLIFYRGNKLYHRVCTICLQNSGIEHNQSLLYEFEEILVSISSPKL